MVQPTLEQIDKALKGVLDKEPKPPPAPAPSRPGPPPGIPTRERPTGAAPAPAPAPPSRVTSFDRAALMRATAGVPGVAGPPAEPRPPMRSATEAGYRVGAGFLPFWRERMATKWQRAQGAVERAGKKDYKEIGDPIKQFEALRDEPTLKRIGLSAITPALNIATNVGQVPVLGKPSTALFHSAMMVLATPAELTESAISEGIRGKFYRRQYGVDTPEEERAFQAANAIFWSGPDRQRALYNAALQKQREGTWNQEDFDKLVSEHSVWWKELLGQAIVDPLNLVGAGGKGVSQLRRTDEARKLWSIADLRPTDDIVRELTELSTRKGQAAVAETFKEGALAYVNPRLTSSFRLRYAEDASQAVAHAAGIAQKRVFGNLVHEGLKPGTEDFVRAFDERFANSLTAVTNQWARLASPDPGEVAEAAALLERHGFGTMPSSTAGRRTAVLLRKMMERPDGSLGELSDAVKLAWDEGLSAEHVVEAWTKKAASVLEELIPEGAIERHALVKYPRRLVQWRKPVDEIFARLYMGINPGYAWRNLGSNMAMSVVQGWSPFRAGSKYAQVAERVGIPVLAARRGIGPAQAAVAKPGLTTFALWLGQKGEQYSSAAIVGQARRDALRHLWSEAVGDVPLPKGLDAETARWLQGRVRAAVHMGPDEIDDIERQLVQRLGGVGGPPAAPVPGPVPGPSAPWEPWRTPSAQAVESLEGTGDDILENALEALRDAESPEDAVERLREFQRAYGEYTAEMADTVPGLGPTAGTPAGEALGQAMRSGDFGPKDLEELGANLGQIQDAIITSRARAFAAAMDTVDPGRWTNYLDDVETQYRSTLQQLRAEQAALYAQLEAKELTVAEYSKEIFERYASARGWLDRQYAKVIGESGGVWQTARPGPGAIARRELALEAGRQGVPTMVHKTGEAVDMTELERYFSLYNNPPPDVVPNKAFRVLLDKLAELEGIGAKKLDEYTDDEILTLLNRLRRREGRPPVDVDELWRVREQARAAGAERGRALPEEIRMPGALPPQAGDQYRGLAKRFQAAVEDLPDELAADEALQAQIDEAMGKLLSPELTDEDLRDVLAVTTRVERATQAVEFRGLAKRLQTVLERLPAELADDAALQAQIERAITTLTAPDATDEQLLDVLTLTTRLEGSARRATGVLPPAFRDLLWMDDKGRQIWGVPEEVLDIKTKAIPGNFRSVTFKRVEDGPVLATRGVSHIGGDGVVAGQMSKEGALTLTQVNILEPQELQDYAKALIDSGVPADAKWQRGGTLEDVAAGRAPMAAPVPAPVVKPTADLDELLAVARRVGMDDPEVPTLLGAGEVLPSWLVERTGGVPPDLFKLMVDPHTGAVFYTPESHLMGLRDIVTDSALAGEIQQRAAYLYPTKGDLWFAQLYQPDTEVQVLGALRKAGWPDDEVLAVGLRGADPDTIVEGTLRELEQHFGVARGPRVLTEGPGLDPWRGAFGAGPYEQVKGVVSADEFVGSRAGDLLEVHGQAPNFGEDALALTLSRNRDRVFVLIQDTGGGQVSDETVARAIQVLEDLRRTTPQIEVMEGMRLRGDAPRRVVEALHPEAVPAPGAVREIHGIPTTGVVDAYTAEGFYLTVPLDRAVDDAMELSGGQRILVTEDGRYATRYAEDGKLAAEHPEVPGNTLRGQYMPKHPDTGKPNGFFWIVDMNVGDEMPGEATLEAARRFQAELVAKDPGVQIEYALYDGPVMEEARELRAALEGTELVDIPRVARISDADKPNHLLTYDPDALAGDAGTRGVISAEGLATVDAERNVLNVHPDAPNYREGEVFTLTGGYDDARDVNIILLESRGGLQVPEATEQLRLFVEEMRTRFPDVEFIPDEPLARAGFLEAAPRARAVAAIEQVPEFSGVIRSGEYAPDWIRAGLHPDEEARVIRMVVDPGSGDAFVHHIDHQAGVAAHATKNQQWNISADGVNLAIAPDEIFIWDPSHEAGALTPERISRTAEVLRDMGFPDDTRLAGLYPEDLPETLLGDIPVTRAQRGAGHVGRGTPRPTEEEIARWARISYDDPKDFARDMAYAMRISMEEAQAVTDLTMARARSWAATYGREPEEWFTRRIIGLERRTWEPLGPDATEAQKMFRTQQYQTQAVVHSYTDGRNMIHGYNQANFASAAHEMAHIFREDLLPDDLALVERWLGMPPGGQWGVREEEAFARGFERYLREGRAPTKELRGVFRKIKQWMLAIYQKLAGTEIAGRPLNPDIRQAFGNLLNEELAAARKVDPIIGGGRELPSRLAQLERGETLRMVMDPASGAGHYVPPGWDAKIGQLPGEARVSIHYATDFYTDVRGPAYVTIDDVWDEDFEAVAQQVERLGLPPDAKIAQFVRDEDGLTRLHVREARRGEGGMSPERAARRREILERKLAERERAAKVPKEGELPEGYDAAALLEVAAESRQPQTFYISPRTGQEVWFYHPERRGEVSFEDFQQHWNGIVARAQASPEPEAQLAAQAADALQEGTIAPPSPTPSVTDAARVGGEDAVARLEELIGEVEELAKLPPPPGAAGPPAPPDEIADFFNELRGRWSDTHAMASDVARRARDFTLLDYNDRRFLDPLIQMIYPWAYWHTRSMPNWATALAGNPAALAGYAKYKRWLRDYNDKDPTVPEWAKGLIVLRPPGVQGSVYLDLEATLNPLYAATQNFDDPDREHGAFGQILGALDKFGPAPHPLLAMAYAAERGLTKKEMSRADPLTGEKEVLYPQDAMRSLGYLAPATRAFSSITGTVIEPWLWVRDPRTGEVTAWKGGTKWDLARATRYMAAEMEREGEVTRGQAMEAAARRAGPTFEQALQHSLAMRRVPAIASTLFGLRVTPRADWEEDLTLRSTAHQALAAKIGFKEASRQTLEEAPWMGTVWMAYDNDRERMENLAWDVLYRVPPGQDFTALWDAVGLSKEMRDAFYETGGDLSQWDRVDYEHFVRSILQASEMLGGPDAEVAKEWRTARNLRAELYDRAEEAWPGIQDTQKRYWEIRRVQGAEAANSYAGGTTLFAYWDWLNQETLKEPLLLKYYVGPGKVESVAKGLMAEAANARWPGIYEVQDAYYDLPKAQRRSYLRNHPELAAYWEWKGPALAEYESGLNALRAQAGKPEGPTIELPEYPTIAQRAAYAASRKPQLDEPATATTTATTSARPPLTSAQLRWVANRLSGIRR